MLNESAISITDKEAAAILRKIAGGEGLPSDNIIERLAAREGEDFSVEQFDDSELQELGSELFYSWFSHSEYISALAELRPIILRSAASENVTRLVQEVKNCYAFQQYDAAYGLCRTLLEASVRDIIDKRGLFPDLGPDVPQFAKYKWGQLRDKVSFGPLREHLNDLWHRLCRVLHARKSATAEEAREAFRETVAVLEELYESHGL